MIMIATIANLIGFASDIDRDTTWDRSCRALVEAISQRNPRGPPTIVAGPLESRPLQFLLSMLERRRRGEEPSADRWCEMHGKY
jgi:hypothetical protein